MRGYDAFVLIAETKSGEKQRIALKKMIEKQANIQAERLSTYSFPLIIERSSSCITTCPFYAEVSLCHVHIDNKAIYFFQRLKKTYNCKFLESMRW